MSISERVDKAIRTIPDFPEKGIMFKDITPILENANLSSDIVDELVKQCAGVKVDAIAGVESRGFLFGFSIGNEARGSLCIDSEKRKVACKNNFV